MQTDATTPNIVAPTMLGVLASMMAVVCKWMQQQCWDLQCFLGRIQPISLCKPCIMSMCGPNNVGRAVITEQKKCWELLAEKFDRFQTWYINTQQHPTSCNRVCERTQHVTSNNVTSICMGLKRISLEMTQSLDKVHMYFLGGLRKPYYK